MAIRRMWVLTLLTLTSTAGATTLQVGPTRTHQTPSAAAAVAQSGDVIEIDAGTYTDDFVTWSVDNLTLRGVGGRAHLQATTQPGNGKAIWVIGGLDYVVENIEFSGCTVPDGNGAGIRHEGENLTISSCSFHDNEDGILTGNGGDIVIEYSEFAHNGNGDVGYTHNMYIGHARSFTLRYSYSHHSNLGQLVKTRAYSNYILYNRLTGEGGSNYELSFCDGGQAVVIGNLIEQADDTDNSTIVTYAEESTSNGNNNLWVVNNTIVNQRGAGGTFIRAAGGTAAAYNNFLVGPGTALQGVTTEQGNLTAATVAAAGFVDAANYDYRLTAASPAINAGVDPGSGGGMSLVPDHEYVHPASTQGRQAAGALDVGAYEYGNVAALDGGTPTDGAAPGDGAAGVDAASGIDGAAATDGGGTTADGGHDQAATDGCGCRPAGRGSLLGAAVLLAGWLASRSRRRVRGR